MDHRKNLSSSFRFRNSQMRALQPWMFPRNHPTAVQNSISSNMFTVYIRNMALLCRTD
jgi:hypothetical protein